MFQQADGKGVKLKPSDVFLMIKGMRSYVPAAAALLPESEGKTKLKLNVGATLATGGIPIFKKTKTKSKAADPQAEWFVRL